MKRLNKVNLGVLVLFILSINLIILDLVGLLIGTINGTLAGFTWYGFISFGLACVIADESLAYLFEIVNKKRK